MLKWWTEVLSSVEKHFFFAASCSFCLYFSTDLALYICSHNSEVWQRLMASNLVSLAKTWHFHMGHLVSMFEREGKETKAGFVCLCIPLSCQPAALNLGTASTLSAQLHQLKGGEGNPCFGWPIYFIWDFNFKLLKTCVHFLIKKFLFRVI